MAGKVMCDDVATSDVEDGMAELCQLVYALLEPAEVCLKALKMGGLEDKVEALGTVQRAQVVHQPKRWAV